MTHSQDEAMALADLILVMNDGIVEHMDADGNFNKPRNAFVANFIGGHNVLTSGQNYSHKRGSNKSDAKWKQ